MAVQIGAKPDSGFDDPIGLLKDCHRRIEHFISVLSLVARTANHGRLSPEQLVAVTTSLRYFRESSARHTADEEESIFSRLKESGGVQVANEMASLESQHTSAREWHEAVDRLFQQWLAAGVLAEHAHDSLRENLSRLETMYTDHILIEESVVFPFAAKAFDSDTLRMVGEEFRRRRE